MKFFENPLFRLTNDENENIHTTPEKELNISYNITECEVVQNNSLYEKYSPEKYIQEHSPEHSQEQSPGSLDNSQEYSHFYELECTREEMIELNNLWESATDELLSENNSEIDDIYDLQILQNEKNGNKNLRSVALQIFSTIILTIFFSLSCGHSPWWFRN